MALPIVALMLFIAIFAVAVARACFKKDAEVRALSALPFATEETWSWFASGSVHRAAWPTVDELPEGGDAGVLTTASAALIGIRRAKTDAKASQKTEVTSCVIAAPAASRAWLEAAAGDLTAVGRIHSLVIAEGPEVAVTSIELAPTSD